MTDEASPTSPISKLDFVMIGGGIFSVGLWLGIRQALKEDNKMDIEAIENQSRSMTKPSNEASKKVILQTIRPPKSSPSTFAFLSKNIPASMIGFRAFAIGSALCFSTFAIGGALFMYGNNLKNLDDLRTHLRQRMKHSFLGKFIKTNPNDLKELEETEAWIQATFFPENKDQSGNEDQQSTLRRNRRKQS
jgi:hypothetical protein